MEVTKRKTIKKKDSLPKSQNEPKNDKTDQDSPNHDAETIQKFLNETLRLVNHKKIKQSDLKNLKSFQEFEKTYNALTNKPNKFQNLKIVKLIKSVFSHWDILILLLLNILFATYLFYFISVYYSTSKTNIQDDFFEKVKLTKNWFLAQWMYYNGFTDLTQESCAVVPPDFFNSIMRPIDNCDMCIDVTEIKRVSNISKEEFLEKYAYTGIPVVITDALVNWTAMTKLNFKFLKELYLKSDDVSYRKRQSHIDIHENSEESPIINTFNSIVETDEQRQGFKKDTCQFFPYKTKFKNLRQVFDMDVDESNKWPKPWYVGWSNCNSYASQVLREHYQRPYFLPDIAEMSRLDWIFMGTPGYGAEMHIDDVENPSWQAQISGIKRWTCKYFFYIRD